MNTSAASQPAQRRRSVQSRKHRERCATKSGSNRSSSSSRTGFQTHHAGTRRVDEGSWWPTHTVEQKATWVQQDSGDPQPSSHLVRCFNYGERARGGDLRDLQHRLVRRVPNQWPVMILDIQSSTYVAHGNAFSDQHGSRRAAASRLKNNEQAL